MLRLRFHTPGQDAEGAVESGAFFRVIGGMLCRGADNEPVATYLRVWNLASSAYGPFESLQLNEGAAWAGTRLLARLDEKSQLWYPPKAHDGWASLLIAPPGRSRFDLAGDRTGA